MTKKDWMLDAWTVFQPEPINTNPKKIDTLKHQQISLLNQNTHEMLTATINDAVIYLDEITDIDHADNVLLCLTLSSQYEIDYWFVRDPKTHKLKPHKSQIVAYDRNVTNPVRLNNVVPVTNDFSSAKIAKLF